MHSFISKSLCLSALLSSSAAFTASPRRSALSKPSTQLNVGMALDWAPEEDELFLMKKAEACANSDTCSLEDMKMYLDDVIHIQSGCASGVLLGSEVCDDVTEAVGVVAGLREKIERESKRVSAINAGVAAVNVSAGLVLLSAFVAGVVATNPDVSPFTPQEWWWAVRDGYLPTMLEHYFRNGGLATIDYGAESTPFALQEWWWAAKGGYLNTMVDHYFQNGGLSTVAFQPESVPITPQEWMWSARDGYLPTMMEENFQNGGLSAGVDSDVLPMTPQELWWAVRDGYLPTMAEHYFRNGGL